MWRLVRLSIYRMTDTQIATPRLVEFQLTAFKLLGLQFIDLQFTDLQIAGSQLRIIQIYVVCLRRYENYCPVHVDSVSANVGETFICWQSVIS